MGNSTLSRFLTMLVLVLAFTQSFRVQAQNAASPPLVRIDPVQNPNLSVGDNFTVQVMIDNAVGVESVQVQLTYDLTVLNATDAEEGPFMPSVGPTITAKFLQPLSDTVGAINFSSAITTGSTASGSGVLLNVTFIVLAAGSSSIHLVPFVPAGSYPGTYLEDINFNNIVPNLADGFYGSPISFVASSTVINVGDTVTLSGEISGPSAASVTGVDLVYTKEGGSWTDLATLSTNGSGYFSRQWTSTESGVFEFRISYIFAGKTTNSSVLDVTVVQPPSGYGIYVLYAGVGVLVIIIAVPIIMQVVRRGRRTEEIPV